MPVEIRKLDHAALLVRDVERSRRFYVQVLGMEEVPRPSNFNFPGAWFRKGSAELHLIGEAEPGRVAQVEPGGYRPDELSTGHGRHIAFEVADLEEARRHLQAHDGDGARVLAGGQSLVPLMNMRLVQPSVLVDINGINELAYIKAWDGGLAIGTLTRDATLVGDSTVAERLPLLCEAARHVGHPAIRNRSTAGGSIAHADPAAELPAVMVALNAEFEVRGRSGSRTIPAQDFFKGYLTTDLKEGELLTELRVPCLPSRAGSAFVEFSRREGDYALAGVR